MFPEDVSLMLLFQLKERGNAFFQRKQYDQALEWYTKAIAEDGSVHAVYTNRAATYFNLGKVCLFLEFRFPAHIEYFHLPSGIPSNSIEWVDHTGNNRTPSEYVTLFISPKH